MTTGRTYGDACGTAHALDLIGDRWALLVVRELLLGPKRYTDLLGDLPGVSTNVLAARLDELEQTGVVRRLRQPPPSASIVYELTHWGAALEPVICSIGRWGAASRLHDRTAHLSVTSFVLSLRTNFDRSRAVGVRSDVDLRLGDERFAAQVRGSRFHIDRGESDQPDGVVTAGPSVLAGVVYGGRTLRSAVRAGDVTVTGDLAAAEQFFRVFTLPETADADQPQSRSAVLSRDRR